jgi:ABC-type multidrug transport system ATPase subunit
MFCKNNTLEMKFCCSLSIPQGLNKQCVCKIDNVQPRTSDMEVKLQSVSVLVEEKPQVLSKSYVTGARGATALALDKVSFDIKPGSVTALFGTGNCLRYLLNCIAHRGANYHSSGRILYDGTARKQEHYKDIAFVSTLKDSNFESLTVFDYLYFGARLRITHDATECRERARQTCRLTGLEATAQLCQLSSTELRIVSIAVEVVGNPTLIVALDPLKGLDAAGALEVLKVLRAVAKRVAMPTTIVCNLPSLSDDMLPLTDSWAIFVGTTLGIACEATDFVPEVHPKLSRVWSRISRVLTQADDRLMYEHSHLTVLATPAAEGAEGTVQFSTDCARVLDGLCDALDGLIEESTERMRYMDNPTTDSSTARSSNKIGLASSSDDYEIENGKFKVGFYPRLSTAGVHSSKSVNELYSNTRRLGDGGEGGTLLVRKMKYVHTELWILLQRAVGNHLRNVRDCPGSPNECQFVFSKLTYVALYRCPGLC